MKSLVPFALPWRALARLCPLMPALLAADEPSARPLAAPSVPASPGAPLFTRMTPEETGIDTVTLMEVNHPMSYLYHSGMTCGGVAVGDFDGDGKPDIFFAGSTGPNQLYRQTGEMKFEDITASAGAGLDGGDAWSAGVTAADVNGDGRLDLYVNNYLRPNQLFLNMGEGPDGAPVRFRECAKEAGLDVVDCSHSAAFADYDGDGRLDVYVLTNRIEDPDGEPAQPPFAKEVVPGELPAILPAKARHYRTWRYDEQSWGFEPIGTPDLLFRQTGVTADGVPTFEDVTAKAGIAGYGDGLSVTWWDPDADGDPDIYVGNDFIEGDRWYENNGDGTFTNVLKQRVPHTPWFSMGADFGDVNGDGRLDLLVADMSATSHFKSKTTMGVMGGVTLKRTFYDDPPQLMRNALYLSTGTGRYEEGAYAYKVSSTDWTWAVKFADYDLDGWQDVYFTNGISRHMNDSDIKITTEMLVGKHMFDFWKDGEMRKEMNRVYQNSHGEKFAEATEAWGLGHVGVSYGSALADLDGDGDPDLITVNLEEPNSIYRNDASNPNRIAVELRGKGANTRALNATVRIRTAQGSQVRHLSPATGYLSCNEPVLLFGLGEDTKVEELSVRWPHGGVQTLKDLAAGQRYVIEEDPDAVRPAGEPPVPPVFSAHEQLDAVKQKDGGWENDFTRPHQSLLPWAFSQLGPALACADVDGDGDTDFFLGGSAGELSQLRINQGDGRFSAKWTGAFAKDKACEDAGAVFLDADGDGDADLFVAGGSNDFEAGAAENRDRLYLNDGKGGFTAAAAGTLPEDGLIGSAVTAADFDRDGDLDLFIGTRLKAWTYPLSETSRLLVNESAGGKPKFVEAPSEMMPALGELGMITAAMAVDLDRDGWVDLLTAAEWGPVRWFRNEEGRLIDRSEAAGLAAVTGFWNSIAVADFNHDGKLDIAAGNLGLNTKYKQPAQDRPHLSYYGEFDANGPEFVEVKREGEKLYPERGRSCSSRAMPFIAEKFGTFKTFALASLDDIYSEEKLAKARRYAVTEFQSGVFLNEGGKFTFQPLPRAAQIAPVFGLSAGDFTGDGHDDLVLTGNFLMGPQIEAGPFDGGLGLVLKGDGKGGLAVVSAAESGLTLDGDHRALVRTDLDGDGRPDLIAATNDGPLEGLRHRADDGGRWLAVRLPQPLAAGAIVTFRRDGQADQTVALTAGGGYWSQDDSVAWFGLGKDAHGAGSIEVNWPDGTKTTREWDGQESALNIAAK